MMAHNELKEKMLSNSEVKAEYDSLEKEFSLFDELLKARTIAGLTQAQVAERMGTKTPAIARLESGGGNKKHSLSLSTLQNMRKLLAVMLKLSSCKIKKSNK